MKQKTSVLLSCVLLAALCPNVGAADGVAPPGVIYEVPAEALPPEAAQRPAPPPIPATIETAWVAVQTGTALTLPELTAAEMQPDAGKAAAGRIYPGPRDVGLARSVGQVPLLLGAPEHLNQQLEDGRNVWMLSIRSPGAAELRVHLTNVNLGDGVLLVYALTQAGPIVRGPYTRLGPDDDGDFWPASLPGDTVFIEATGTAAPVVELAEIIHVTPEPLARGQEAAMLAVDCHLDAMCYGNVQVNVNARQAVGRMRYLRDGTYRSCTGTLIADMDAETFMPYFLTANHCVDETINLDTLEVYWFYQSDGCEGSVPYLFDLPYNVDATLLATSGAQVGNDASFLRLHGGLPDGVGFAGWTTNEEMGTVGIHHPGGSYKRIVFAHYESLSTGCGLDCGCFTPANYAFYEDEAGIIEPGSSGSGMFTQDGRILGQLFGTCTLCPDAFDCEHRGDYCMQYGEFAQTYPDIEYWLRLGGTIWVNRANTTAPFNGLQTDPYPTVVQGYNAAWDGSRVKIVAGNYPETPTLGTPGKRIRMVSAGGTVRIGG